MAPVKMWFQDTEANILATAPTVPNLVGFATDTGRWFVVNLSASAWVRTTLTPRGAYNAGTTYQRFDVVTDTTGNAWLALQQTVGNAPTEGVNWTLFVGRGPQGIQGIQGPAGDSSYGYIDTSFTQPAVNANVAVHFDPISNANFTEVGMTIFMAGGGGYYQVISYTSGTSITIMNLGYSGNANPGATVSPNWVSPAGPIGNTGSTGPAGPAGSGGWKDPVRVASTANVVIATGGFLTIDGVALSASDRVLLKDQTTGSENGIYSVASGAWTRTSDANTSGLMIPGLRVGIGPEGTANKNLMYELTTLPTITLGTTSLTFQQKPQWSEIGSVPTRYQNLTFFASGNVNVKTGVGHEIATTPLTADSVYVNADTAPAGGTVTATAYKEAGGPGGGQTTIGAVTLAIASRGTTSTTGLSVALAVGDTVRVDITTGAGYTADSCKNLTAKVRCSY